MKKLREAFALLNSFVKRMKYQERITIPDLILLVREIDGFTKLEAAAAVHIYLQESKKLVSKRGRYGGVFKGSAPVAKPKNHHPGLKGGVFYIIPCPFCKNGSSYGKLFRCVVRSYRCRGCRRQYKIVKS